MSITSKYMNSWCVYCIVKIKSILNQKTTKLFLRFTKPSRKTLLRTEDSKSLPDYSEIL